MFLVHLCFIVKQSKGLPGYLTYKFRVNCAQQTLSDSLTWFHQMWKNKRFSTAFDKTILYDFSKRELKLVQINKWNKTLTQSSVPQLVFLAIFYDSNHLKWARWKMFSHEDINRLPIIQISPKKKRIASCFLFCFVLLYGSGFFLFVLLF